jgi:hypothetical protein
VRDTECVGKTLQEPTYARLWKYYQDLKAHPCVTSTWNVVRPVSLQLLQIASDVDVSQDLLRAVFVCEAACGTRVSYICSISYSIDTAIHEMLIYCG